MAKRQSLPPSMSPGPFKGRYRDTLSGRFLSSLSANIRLALYAKRQAPRTPTTPKELRGEFRKIAVRIKARKLDIDERTKRVKAAYLGKLLGPLPTDKAERKRDIAFRRRISVAGLASKGAVDAGRLKFRVVVSKKGGKPRFYVASGCTIGKHKANARISGATVRRSLAQLKRVGREEGIMRALDIDRKSAKVLLKLHALGDPIVGSILGPRRVSERPPEAKGAKISAVPLERKRRDLPIRKTVKGRWVWKATGRFVSRQAVVDILSGVFV